MRLAKLGVGRLTVAPALLAAGGAALGIAFAWHAIGIPFSNPAEIVGPLSRIGYHPANNVIRLALFLAVPTVLFLALVERSEGPGGRAEPTLRPGLAAGLVGLVSVWAVFRAVRQLVHGWGPPPELFHFGELLTPAWIFNEAGTIWTSTFFAHGAFHDVFATWLGWWLAGDGGVAGPVAIQSLLHSLWVPGVAGLLLTMFAIARQDAGDPQAVCLIVLLVAGIHIAQENGPFFATRDFLVLVGLSVVLSAVLSGRLWLWFAGGLLVPLTLLHAIDRGTYLAVIVAAAWAFEGARARAPRRSLWSLLAGVAAGGLVWLLVFGPAEVAAFLENYLFWARYKDYLDAYVTPGPLDWGIPGYPIVWWSALAACLTLAWNLARPTGAGTGAGRTLHFTLTVAGLLFLRNALGRSDVPHLRYSCVLIGVAAIFGIWRLAAPRIRWQPKVAHWALVALGLLTLVETGRSVRELGRFIDGELPITKILNQSELDYLPEAARRAAPQLREMLDSEPCLFALPSEPAWYYHLRKPPCSRFYVTWFAAPASHQREVIRDLERQRPRRILFESPMWTNRIDRIPPQARYPTLFDYLQDNYRYLQSFEGFVVFERRAGPPP